AADFLYVDEIYEAHLDSLRVAVLSACSTAQRGSGTTSGSSAVARALMSNGVPVVIGTLWPLPDEAAEAVAKAFHRALRAGNTPAEATRLAQVDLMSGTDSTFHSPAIWSAFVTCGAGPLL